MSNDERVYPIAIANPKLRLKSGVTQSSNFYEVLMDFNSENLAKYIEATDGISKPWLLVQLRLKKLQERRFELSSQEYREQIADIHEDMMKLGEWWVDREDEVFGKADP
jgi:predicted house-cleaning noncanonical NTP pyrophosphatase (MazG superfamily)